MDIKPVIELENLRKSYFLGKNELPVLTGLIYESKKMNLLPSWVRQDPGKAH